MTGRRRSSAPREAHVNLSDQRPKSKEANAKNLHLRPHHDLGLFLLDVIDVCTMLLSIRRAPFSRMDPNPRPNHPQYIQALRSMTPAQRLAKAFELTELGRQLFIDGLRHRHPGLPEGEIRGIYLEHIAKCHNAIY
jgi:hypothetical protein